jgi:hypothetical protein
MPRKRPDKILQTALVNDMILASNNQNGANEIVYKEFNTSIANLKTSTNLFYPFVTITDVGKEGMFKYDSTDTTSVNDDIHVIVDNAGKRWKRTSDIVNTHLFKAISIAGLQAYTQSTLAYFDGSVWEKVSGNIASNGGSFPGTVININASFYWKRIYDDYINVKWFGAKGDNSTNDSTSIQKAVDSGHDKLFAPNGSYKIVEPIIITRTGLTIEGESDYNTSFIAYGTGLFQIGSTLNGLVEHVTLSNFTYYGMPSFTGKSYIIVKRAFQTYFERIRYKYSQKIPTEAIVVLDNEHGRSEQPVRVTFKECYFDGDDYNPSSPLLPTPIAIWNTGGIQVIVDNTHIQDVEIGVKCGVNPLLDTDYYDITYPNDHDFNDFYFINNSRYQVGDRGYNTNNARAFDIWEGGNVVIDNSTIYLNNNAPTPSLTGQTAIRFNQDNFEKCSFTNNLINFNARAEQAFEFKDSSVVKKLVVSGNSFIANVPYKNLIKTSSSAIFSAVFGSDNYYSNPNTNGANYYMLNEPMSPFNLGTSPNIYYTSSDSNNRTFSSFDNGVQGQTYIIEFAITSGSITLISSSNLITTGIIVDGISGNLLIENGDILIVNKSPTIGTSRYYARLIKAGQKKFSSLLLEGQTSNPLDITGTSSGAFESLLRIRSAKGNSQGFHINTNSATDVTQLINPYSANLEIGVNIPQVVFKSLGSVNFVPLTVAPISAVKGDIYMDDTTNKLRCYDGTAWNDLF